MRHLGGDGIVESFSASPSAVDPSLDKDTAWQTRITKENRWIFTFEGLDSVKNPCHPCLQIQCVYSPGNAVVLHFHLECGELAYGSYCSTGVLRGVGSVMCPLEASSHFFASVTTSPNSSANHSCKNQSKWRRRIETPSSTCNTNLSKN